MLCEITIPFIEIHPNKTKICLSKNWHANVYRGTINICPKLQKTQCPLNGTEWLTPKYATLSCGLSELKAHKFQQTQNKQTKIYLYLSYQKNLDRGSERELLPEITFYLNDTSVWQGKHQLSCYPGDWPSCFWRPSL